MKAWKINKKKNPNKKTKRKNLLRELKAESALLLWVQLRKNWQRLNCQKTQLKKKRIRQLAKKLRKPKLQKNQNKLLILKAMLLLPKLWTEARDTPCLKDLRF